jgi:hypothetical protein
MTFLIIFVGASKNGTIVGKIPKDIRGHLFPTVAVHSQNEEYVLTLSLKINTIAIMYLTLSYTKHIFLKFWQGISQFWEEEICFRY